MFRNHVFYRINTYQLSMKKLLAMNPTMGQMPVIYTGYKSLDDYVSNTTRLVALQNNILLVSKDPTLHSTIHRSFNQLQKDSSLCRALGRGDTKSIIVSYRISCFLMNNTPVKHTGGDSSTRL